MNNPQAHKQDFASPNDAQLAASDPASSVWVNASAGSGKTTVLTKRVTRLLLSGVRPEKILCLTYTKAGAAEMSNRITAILGKWAVCSDDELDEDLDKLQNTPPKSGQRMEARRLFAKVLACPGGLKIRTIHSFCQEIISRFPIESGIPPHFSLIEGQALQNIKNEVIEDLLRDAEQNTSTPLAIALSEFIKSRGEKGFNDMLQELASAHADITVAMEKAGGLDKLIGKTRAFLGLSDQETSHSIKSDFIRLSPIEDIRKLAKWWAEGSKRYSDRGNELLSFLALGFNEQVKNFDKYADIFLTSKLELFSESYIASKDMLKRNPEIVDLYKNEAFRVLSTLERIESVEIANATLHALIIGGEFSRRVARRKAARAALDYDDLIRVAENLLNRKGATPWILYKLDQGIDHILVDEAQDTSRAQWSIVQALTGEFFSGEGSKNPRNRSLFVVGDEKQSIFSFQNADPEAFLSLRENFFEKAANSGNPMRHIALNVSFRSAPPVLQAVDAIFADESVRQGVSEEEIKHTPSKNKDGSEKLGRVEIWPLVEKDEKQSDIDGEWNMPTEREEDQDPQIEVAKKIARKIKGWLKNKEALPGYSRPIEPSDIMILLRKRGRFASLMVKELKAASVPVTGVDRMRLIRQLSVMDLLSALRFSILPEDDLNLAELLRSPIIGASEEDLMEISIGRDNTLWQSLKNSERLSPIREYLETLLNKADFITPFDLLSFILNTPCPCDDISGRKALWKRLGDECLDPIDELLNAAQDFSLENPPSLQNFLRWLTKADAEIKRELDKGDQKDGGQVRIMTAHASKGLEAPIVFLPDTTSPPLSKDLPRLQWSESGAPVFMSRKPKFANACRLWGAAETKQFQEYRRLLYVALTRASSRLYIAGWAEKRGTKENGWHAIAKPKLEEISNEKSCESFEAAISNSPELAITQSKEDHKKPPPPLPEWARRCADIDLNKTPTKPPSKELSAASPDAAFARGRIIHRLLQSLPDMEQGRRKDAARKFLAANSHEFSAQQLQEIETETLRLIEDARFALLFSPNSMAEVGITGTLDGTPAFRQIDRVCFNDNEAWIVDFKTNRPPPKDAKDAPEAYIKQMHEYRELLRSVYPEKKVRCFLLWTYAPCLMEII